MSETPPIRPGRRFDFDAFAFLVEMGIKAHASNAILSAAVLDEELKKLLLAKMRQLSNNKQDALFEGFGPLSELAAKIEVAHAFGLIDEEIYLDLRTIKKIRDTFAHTPKEIHFRSEEIAKLLKSFKAWNSVIDPLALFGQRVKASLDYLKERATAAADGRGP